MEELPYDVFVFACNKLVDQIKEANIEVENIFGVPRGGLVVAVYLSHLLDKPVVLKPIDAKTLVVDDIADSGISLKPYITYHTAVVYYNQKHSVVVPDFYVFKTAKEFIKFPWETSETALIDYKVNVGTKPL
jgi:hypoxanthine phosphoribosyltransferase